MAINKFKKQDYIRLYHVDPKSSVGRGLRTMNKLNNHLNMNTWWGLVPRNRRRAEKLLTKTREHVTWVLNHKVDKGYEWHLRRINGWYEICVKPK